MLECRGVLSLSLSEFDRLIAFESKQRFFTFFLYPVFDIALFRGIENVSREIGKTGLETGLETGLIAVWKIPILGMSKRRLCLVNADLVCCSYVVFDSLETSFFLVASDLV